ncbi:hypothetical protein Taro_009062 [Colocasia esculenta]|uniref:Retrotransposon gag domain-containing protein n=1 Tax=Colocasia esculenta TaxID=4460 RepID=A0A843U8Y0_COLES|nr:hypothetical protein [Colocasia esculenta]
MVIHIYEHEVEMADRRDWGGGGEDPEESTQCMIERIWESLTDIWMRMDQQAPVPPAAVPPVAGVPVAPVVPPLGVEVPYVAPVPPPPVAVAEEPVMQIEKFLRLQPPTHTGGPTPDTTEHWIHEIERVFTTMRCLAADRVVLAAYQLRGFAQQWWRLKMQTTFAGRTEEASGSGSGSFRLPQQAARVSKGKALAGPSSSGFGKWGQKLKQVFKGKGRGGRQQFQQGRGYKQEVEESQQSTARQPTIPRGHLIRNCPYLREYGYGRGVQQQQQPQQSFAGCGGGEPQ